MIRTLIVWGNWGPYHYARFQAFRRFGAQHGFAVQGLQLFPRSGFYEWKEIRRADDIHYLDLGSNESRFRPVQLLRRVLPLLRRLQPQVVFVPSYWHWSLFINYACRLYGARIVMMNETHAGTESPARGLKRMIKRRIVSAFDAALVGGAPHRRFFSSLGLPIERIFVGYDAVDNDHFTRAAAAARGSAASHRARLGLPERYFLSLGRFVPKKNLPLLVQAFAEMCRVENDLEHDLVFVGSGETEDGLRALCGELSLPVVDHRHAEIGSHRAHPQGGPAVHFFGFRQIDENPVFYGLATAFVLPSAKEEWGLVVNEAMACGLPVVVSRTAGCAEDLVEPGVNGFVFDPTDARELGGHLRALAADPAMVTRMGAASAKRIRSWGCDRFAQAAVQAAQAAFAHE